MTTKAPERMSTTQAIVRYFDPPKVTMAELKALKLSMPQDAWDVFGRAVCEALGAEWEATK